MDAKNLMIGDYVKVDGKVGKVAFIDEFGDIDVSIDETLSLVTKQPNPISITPEILKKNGFTEKNVFAETMGCEIFGDENNGCGLSIWYDGDWAFETLTPWTETAPDGSPEDWGFKTESRITKIKYVHELQHALRLCGIDLEIKL